MTSLLPRILTIFVLLSSVASYATEKPLNYDECDRLIDGATRMYPAKNEIQDNFSHWANQVGIKTKAQSFFEWAGIKPEEHSQIVLLSLNNFFGDGMVFHFSMMDYFLKTFPKVPLLVISPKGSVLSRPAKQPFDWATYPVRYAEFQKRADRDFHINLISATLPDFVETRVKPGALIIFDLTIFDKVGDEIDPKNDNEANRPIKEFERVVNELGATAVGVSNLRGHRIMMGISGIEMIAPKEKLDIKLFGAKGAAPVVRARDRDVRGVTYRGEVEFGANNIYQSWLQNFAFMVGPSAYLHWDKRHYINLQEDPKLVHDFKIQAGLDPHKPHVFINLNTFGGDKVKDLSPVYAETLMKLVNHTLQSDPNTNVLVPFPEYQFGPETQTAILDFVAGLGGRVALVPSSVRELVPAIIGSSKWVISYDTGLVHLSSFLPRNKVLSISLHSGGNEIWRRPDQPYVKIEKGQDPNLLAEKAMAWISTMSQKLNKDTDQ